MRRALVVLKARYEGFLNTEANSEVEEEAALLAYSSGLLDEMGLERTKLRAAKMVRTIERGELGARRDHFFHSFQNYFYGLEVVAEQPALFDGYRAMLAVNAMPDPFDIWFLTALWHDTGYTLQKSGEYFKETLGTEFNSDDAVELRRRFLRQTSVQNGLRELSALSSHLLFPRSGRRWDPMSPVRRLQGHAAAMQQAYKCNVDISHGALGGLQLFSDFEEDLNRLDSAKSQVLKLAIQVAGCSMPFHDYYFRHNVRTECGTCSINPDSLPFASLLAFVDSIQDDRRDLLSIAPGIPALSKLQISKGLVTAQLNFDAVPHDDLLLKIVESRDVLAALDQSGSQLRFGYPDWMTF